MQKYKVIVEYNGTNYHGMQKQKDESDEKNNEKCNLKTIQGVLEEAISKFANEKIEVDYAGRTDAGVHAIGQVVHFTLPEERDEYKVVQGINFYLVGEDIVIKTAEKVDNDFHSRFSAKRRVYLYRVLNRKVHSPLLDGRVFHCPYALDIKAMRKVAKMFVGKKMDFASFCNKESVEKVNTMKTINSIKIKKVGEEIHFIFEAKSFLHNMIRIMTGVLVEVGRGKIDKNYVMDMLKKKTRDDNCNTLPACGLYFLEVKY